MTITNSFVESVLVFIGTAFVASILFMSLPAFAHASTLDRQLQVGMSGSDVSTLQSFLAEDTSIYPQGLVTGYFGFLTKAAVSNYQSRNGIDPVGRVGPVTLASINAQMAGGVGAPGADVTSPLLSTINVNTTNSTAAVSWTTNEPAKGIVYYSSSRLTEYEYPHSVTISGTPVMTDAVLHTSQNVVITGLTPNTVYFYDVYVTDASGNTSLSTQTTFHTAN